MSPRLATFNSTPPAPGPSPRPRLLMLTHRLPYPPDRGDRIRSYNLLRMLRGQFDISLACTSDEKPAPDHLQAVKRYVTNLAVHRISGVGSKVGAALAIGVGRAGTPSAFYRKPLARTIVHWHEQQPFDVVLTFCTGMVRYARHLTDPQHARSPISGHTILSGQRHRAFQSLPAPRHVLDLVDVDSLKWQAYAERSRSPMRHLYGLESRRLQKIEAGAYDRFDAITVISDAEADAYTKHIGKHPNLVVVGNGVDIDYFKPLSDAGGHTLCFIGVLDYPPNVQGLRWFADEVWPSVRERYRNATLLVVGRDPSSQAVRLADVAGINVIGPVDDVRETLGRSAAVIAPLQIARGVQNKVLEAMSSARAVICSKQAFAGIDAEADRHLLVADGPAEWIEKISRMFDNRNARSDLAARARQHITAHYTWPHRLAPMLALLGADSPKPMRRAG